MVSLSYSTFLGDLVKVHSPSFWTALIAQGTSAKIEGQVQNGENGQTPTHPSICMRRKKVETKQGKRSICTNHIEDAKSGMGM